MNMQKTVGFTILISALSLLLVSCSGDNSAPIQQTPSDAERTATEPAKSSSTGIPSNHSTAATDPTFADYTFKTVFPNNTFKQPVGVRSANDGTNRLYVVERAGRILVLEPTATGYTSSLFLDLTRRVNATRQEMGLLGLAFHPDYRNNGLFYVNYTSRGNQTVISSFRKRSNLPQGDPISEKIMLRFSQPFPNHNGGDMAFGPDGYLYIASGDGGSANDPRGNGQNLRTLLGKILRIDVTPKTVNGRLVPYQIPANNPFVNGPRGTRPEIYAYGLRNPWRISFDRQTGQLWAADVGQNRMEEINLIESGGNYGWVHLEGTQCIVPKRLAKTIDCSSPMYKAPIHTYNHSSGSKSVTGGYVYRGKALPELQGHYVFADFVSGRIWALSEPQNNVRKAMALPQTIGMITSFGEDEQGELFAVNYRGALLQLVAATN